MGLDEKHAAAATDPRDSEVPRGHESLAELATIDARFVQVVEMRYFGGMTEPEFADALGLVVRTVVRDWVEVAALPACLLAQSAFKVNAGLVQN